MLTITVRLIVVNIIQNFYKLQNDNKKRPPRTKNTGS